MALQSLRALFVQHLKSIYSGEHQLSKSLPKILQGVSSQEVRSLVRDYQLEAEERCERLEAISKMIKEDLSGERCSVMEAFVRHANALSELRGEETILDLAILTTLRQIGHFEKSSYEIVRSFAEVLEQGDVCKTIEGMLSQVEASERALILLSEDMLDSAARDTSTRDYGVMRVTPREVNPF